MLQNIILQMEPETDIVIPFPDKTTIDILGLKKPIRRVALIVTGSVVTAGQSICEFSGVTLRAPVDGIIRVGPVKGASFGEEFFVIRARKSDVPSVNEITAATYTDLIEAVTSSREELQATASRSWGSLSRRTLVSLLAFVAWFRLPGAPRNTALPYYGILAGGAVLLFFCLIWVEIPWKEIKSARRRLAITETPVSVRTRPVDHRKEFIAMLRANKASLAALGLFELPVANWRFAQVEFRRAHLLNIIDNGFACIVTDREKVEAAYSALAAIKNSHPDLC